MKFKNVIYFPLLFASKFLQCADYYYVMHALTEAI